MCNINGLRSINQKIEAILIYLPNFAFSSSLRVLKLSCACNVEDTDVYTAIDIDLNPQKYISKRDIRTQFHLSIS